MRDTLPLYPCSTESGIVNLNISNQAGSHWVCYYRNNTDRTYFDSYGQIPPVEIQRYLKTGSEFDRGKEVIQRNTDIVQAVYTSVRDHLCLFVLKSLTSGEKFQSILNHIQHYSGYTQGDCFRLNRKLVLFYQSIALLDPTTLYIYNWIWKITHYREMSHIMPLIVYQCIMTSAIEIRIHRLVNVNVTVKR